MMKLQKTTWVLVAVAILLVGVVYFYEGQRKFQGEQIQANEKKLFDFQEEEIQELTIETQKETLRFERTETSDRSWQMKQPEDVPASEPVVAFLLNLLVEAKRDRALTIPPNKTQEYGLDKPFAKLDIKLKNGEKQQLILGKLDFEGQSLYAIVNPSIRSKGEYNGVLVSQDFQFALDRNLAEWKQQEETSQGE
jgi:hypothetical protein